MSEETQDNPKFVFKDIALGESMELTLESSKPVKTGENQYGTWNLWFGSVEDTKVHIGRGKEEKVEEGYTGKVIFFPATKLNENLLKAANNNEGVKVKITKTAEEGMKGLITNYVVEKLSEGKPSDSSLTPTEFRLINEGNSLIEEGHKLTEDIFVKASQEPQYEGKISIARAKKIYTMLD